MSPEAVALTLLGSFTGDPGAHEPDTGERFVAHDPRVVPGRDGCDVPAPISNSVPSFILTLSRPDITYWK